MNQEAEKTSRWEACRVYWFSGTGNALAAARWLKDHTEAAGIKSSVHAMEDTTARDQPAPTDSSLLGFCYPTHGFAPPWLVLKYLWQFPRGNGATAFFVNTRAGVGLPGIWLPGLSGIALWWPILLFYLRGYRIGGSLPLDMPHSWLIFFPPNPKSGIAKLTARCQRIVSSFSQTLIQGGVYHRYSVWLTLPLDLALLPITFGYIVFGRFALAKLVFAGVDCNNCRLCEKNCPVGAISLRGGRPYWSINCESCMRCLNICPKRTVHSWFFQLIPISWALLVGLSAFPMDINHTLLIGTALLFPMYWVFHHLWRIRAINTLFTYTTPTRLWGRYLAPTIKPKDLLRRAHRAKQPDRDSPQPANQTGPTSPSL